jgi:oligopeptide/dipeptide ABC transporter ATP-binding protein
MMLHNEKILQVDDLVVNFERDGAIVRALNGVSFSINTGQAVGIVGESGCGKSVTAYSILGLLPSTARIVSGSIKYRKGEEAVEIAELMADGKEIREIRGAEIAMIFQEPMTAFSPVHTIGNQIGETIMYHKGVDKKEARRQTIELLRKVGISKPEQRVDEYPFQYSGGMRQRAMIAMGLCCEPKLLIADEPTTALDVTIQAQVLKLIRQMQNDYRLSLMLITHDLGVIAHMVDYVNVMYLGRVVEAGPVKEIFDNPAHPYTRDLLRSIPKITGVSGKLASIEGSVPDAYSLPSGCSFHPRCSDVLRNRCEKETPPLVKVGDNHFTSCFLHQPGGDK